MQADSVFRCSAWMGIHGINIYSPTANVMPLLQNSKLVYAVPEYRCNDTLSESGYSLEVIISEGSSFSLKIGNDGKCFTVISSMCDLVAGDTLPYLIHSVLEVQRLEDGQFTMRGAAVAKDGKGILLLGRSGAGKTSVSLSLCRDHGFSLVGNNIVLAGMKDSCAYLYGGEKIFRFRRASVLNYNTDLLNAFKPEAQRLDDWTATATVIPEQLGITVSEGKIQIVAVLYLHLLNEPEAELRVEPMNPLFSRLFLYEMSSAYIRGICSPILIGSNLRFGGFFPCLDTPEFHARRVEFINWVVENPHYNYVSGSMASLCSYAVSI